VIKVTADKVPYARWRGRQHEQGDANMSAAVERVSLHLIGIHHRKGSLAKDSRPPFEAAKKNERSRLNGQAINVLSFFLFLFKPGYKV
jgi:hypothetical protein